MEGYQELRTPHFPVYGCWYEENPELGQLEISGLQRFCREYGQDRANLSFTYDRQKRMAVNGLIHFRTAAEKPWQIWKFVMLFEQDYSGRRGICGGGIKVYVLGTVDADGKTEPIKKGCPHVIWDPVFQRYYASLEGGDRDEINGYYMMKRFLRWLLLYNHWAETGKVLQ